MARRKKNTPEAANDIVEKSPVDLALDNSRDRFVDVIVIGIDSRGLLDLVPSTPNYSHINHLLNRAILEILLHEKGQIVQAAKQAEGE